ncbi:MAG: hypothetical protein QXQ79_02965 [Candidatus Nanoarchaeia archaeon]
MPEIPEIDFDKTPKESFEEIKELPIRHWRKLLENEKLWTEGIIKAIFRNGKTLGLISNYFKRRGDKPYLELNELLENWRKHYK